MKFAIMATMLTASSAFAWGPVGHKTTALIGEAKLSPKAAAQVNYLLDGKRLVDVVTWADDVRANDPRFKQTGNYPFHNLPDVRGDGKPELLTFKETLQPIGEHKPTAGVVEAILAGEKTLADKTATKEEKAIALKFLVHFIGDLHQPLHVGMATDRGGNQIKMKWMGEESNLHKVWDSGMIRTHQQALGHPMSFKEGRGDPAKYYAQYVLDSHNKVPISQATVGRLDIWLEESRGLLPTIYDTEKATGAQEQYYKENLPLVDQRLYEGGMRIAETLNRIFEAQALAQVDLQLESLITENLGALEDVIQLSPKAKPVKAPRAQPQPGTNGRFGHL